MVNIVLPDGTKVNYRDIIKDDPDDLYFLKTMNKFARYTLTFNRGIEPSYSLYKAVQYVVKNKIPGDFVECGVWRGGSVILIALALAHFGDTDRKIFLYDTFTGMTKPDEQDVDWDTDWYASTYHELVHLYPIISAGGILIIDDYGWCRGSRQATDKYIKEHKLDLFLSRIDESVRLAVKR